MNVKDEPRLTAHETVARETARLIAGAVGERVLVLGSVPPRGRDLELVVRPPEQEAIAKRLTAEGFARRGLEWARFFDCTAYAVELIPAARLALPAAELEALFAEAQPVDEEAFPNVVRPATHHLLLLQARRLVRDGRLHPKRRRRLADALAEEPGAWRKAEARAPAWGLLGAMRLLETAYESGAPAPLAQRARALLELAASTPGMGERLDLIRRPVVERIPRKNRIVAISGLDGAGKSFQAQVLRTTLEHLVVPSVVEWRPLGHNRGVEALRLARRLLHPLGGGSATADAPLPRTYDDIPPDAARKLRERSAVVTHAWTFVVVLANVAFHCRPILRYPFRGRIVVFDRYVCDSSVQVQFWYGRRRSVRLERRVLRVLSPPPLRSFWLNVRPEVALIRKGEFTAAELRRQVAVFEEETRRVGAIVLDGEDPPAEIAARIAREVWTAVP